MKLIFRFNHIWTVVLCSVNFIIAITGQSSRDAISSLRSVSSVHSIHLRVLCGRLSPHPIAFKVGRSRFFLIVGILGLQLALMNLQPLALLLEDLQLNLELLLKWPPHLLLPLLHLAQLSLLRLINRYLSLPELQPVLDWLSIFMKIRLLA